MTRPKTILIADDETHILNVLSIKLQNADFQVLTVEDGEEAFDLIQTARPDLLITDYQMPSLSGLELCRRLERDPATRDLPVIMLTARGFNLPKTDLGNIQQVMTKPFSPREILQCVQGLLKAAPDRMAVVH